MISSVDVTPENFVQAVQMLYHDHDATRKKLASEWLLNVQSSLYAWTLADQLIRMNQNSEVTCLSAQILRHKIQHNFDELPVEHCQGLRDSLLDHLSRAELTRQGTVRVQLAVATADLALQYVGWEKPVEDVVEKLKTSSEHMLTLLEFLTALPEEVNTSTICIGENRRQFCRQKYSNCGKQIHDILVCLLQVDPNFNEHLFIGILKCFAAWISIRAFDETLLLHSPLLNTALTILKSTQYSKDLHKHACDCLCNLLELCENHEKYWSILIFLKQEILQHLVPPYFQSVKDENVDKAQNYTRIFTNFVESILDCLFDGRHSDLSDLSSLHLLLYPLEHSDYEVVQATFYSWYRLSESIPMENEILLDKLKPYMDKFIDLLCVQCKLDSDHLGIPPEIDEKNSKVAASSDSDLAEFRYRVECLVRDTIYITGALNCFQRMFEKLQTSINLSWEESEAPLYLMSCVASYLTPGEDQIVCKVIEAILSTQSAPVHIALKYTGVRLLGQLDFWIESNHQLTLKPILHYLLSLLIDQNLRSIAAETILIVCQQCRKYLVDELDRILEATFWLDSLESGSEATQCLLKASSKIISRLTSTDDIQRYLKLLFDQQIQYLNKVLEQQTDGNFGAIAKRLDCLTAIFRSFDFKVKKDEIHPCATVVQQLLPSLELIIYRYRSTAKLSECWSRAIRFILRSMSSHAKLFSQRIVNLIIASYEEVPHSCFLYLISIIVDEFGDEEEFKSYIIRVSEHLTTKTFSILNHSEAFKQYPDLVDDFYRLSARLLQRCPSEFLKSNIICPIIEHIIPNCHLEHRDASASMMAFLQSLVKLSSASKKENKNKSETRTLAIGLCAKYLPDLLIGFLRAVVIQRVPSSIRLSVAEFICDLKISLDEQFRHWLRKALDELPKKSKNGLVEIVTAKQHEQFYQTLCECDTQPSTIDYELETFAKLYR